jgi:hypothetical protein
MTVVSSRGFQHDSDVLRRQVDRQLALLRAAPPSHESALAERLAACLRELIESTTRSSAADRARVRAAVHYFVLRSGHHRHHERMAAPRSLVADQRVVNEIAVHLGRPDLVVETIPVTARAA